jgi:hypothetical protein
MTIPTSIAGIIAALVKNSRLVRRGKPGRK